MSHGAHNDNNIQHLYEGDQSKLYSGVLAHHHDVKSDESKAQVKKIWKITFILSVITVVEVLGGLYLSAHLSKVIINSIFLILTVLKSAYIVSVFMHLGDEVKWFRNIVLMPLVLFIWFIIAFLYDGGHWKTMNNENPARFDYHHAK
ncbi:cytochrome C oxidase subunit IV family protein [Rurimicrobium arvi]|uniref:Cytochrome C oxidase subunit IV n=1 Tax=Rurimicrobium arvi TaxID=2049916 RepID=A0ABP8MQN5_9BACT